MQAFVSGGSTNGNLNDLAGSPGLVKINNVSSQSTLSGVTDYVVIHNPTGGAVDVTGWEIAIGVAAGATIDAGDLVGGLYAWDNLNIPAGGFLALDMANWGGLSNTANSIKLIASGGWIVDRVEYGTIGASPEETIMGNAVNPASGQEIYRTTAGTDTNQCDVDFATQANWLPIDTTPPTSAVDPISPYWYNTSPLAITATASDTGGSGLASVELWYNFASDGASWVGWALFGTDNSAPWSWNFNWPDQEGAYEFYSRATDGSGNYEAAPGVFDAEAGYDITDPVSSVDVIAPYWWNTSPLTVTVTASDPNGATNGATWVSGVDTVDLEYDYELTGWVNFGTDAAAPWSFSFTWPSGQGNYDFRSIATDVAGNTEAGGALDTEAGYDNQAPDTTVDPDGGTYAAPTLMTATCVDVGPSGLDYVNLYYSWQGGPDTLFGQDTAAPWEWTFTFPDGIGYYEYYTRGMDNAGNFEAAAVNDTWNYYDPGGKEYGPPAPTNVRLQIVGTQATGTDVNLTWTDEATAVSYNIYRGTLADAINFGAPVASVAQGMGLWTDPGAIGGSQQYYYTLRSVSGTGVEGETSATVGKWTLDLGAGYNALGWPVEPFPEYATICPDGDLMCDWLLIDDDSPLAIPSASTFYTFDQPGQGWLSRTPTTPEFFPHNVIDPVRDGVMAYLDAADTYTFFGWPAEQIRMANFIGAPVLAAPGNFDIAWSGSDIYLTWDVVAGADHYELYTVSSRNLENYNFGAPVYSGLNNFYTDTNANVTVGQTYYIVAAVDADGDQGDSAYALGKDARDIGAGYNALTTPFEPWKGEVCADGHRICDYLLIDDDNAPKVIPSASTFYTFDQPGQGWLSRTPTTPEFFPHNEFDLWSACFMVYMDAAEVYTWIS
jgi:hypothetical protein